jgi:hypothetical protein
MKKSLLCMVTSKYTRKFMGGLSCLGLEIHEFSRVGLYRLLHYTQICYINI